MIPNQKAITVPILEVLQDKSHYAREITATLAERLNITDDELDQKYSSGALIFDTIIRFALLELKKAGLVNHKDRSYSLSKRGKDVIRDGLDPLKIIREERRTRPKRQEANEDKRRDGRNAKKAGSGRQKSRTGRSTKGRAAGKRTQARLIQGIPDAKDLAPHILEICGSGRNQRIADLQDGIASRLGLTRRERDCKYPRGGNVLYNRTYAAAKNLIKDDLLEYRNRQYTITKSGRVSLERSGSRKKSPVSMKDRVSLRQKIPRPKDIAQLVLEICASKRGQSVASLQDEVAVRLGLTTEEKNYKLPGGGNALYNRVYDAAKILTRRGMLDYRNKQYNITESGRVSLERSVARGGRSIGAEEQDRLRQKIPLSKDLTQVVLEICASKGSQSATSLQDEVAVRLGLTPEEKNAELPSGYSALFNRARAAAGILVRKGLLDYDNRRYTITKSGKMSLERDDAKKERLSRLVVQDRTVDKTQSSVSQAADTATRQDSKEHDDRRGIPMNEDRLNEFKEHYQYDPGMEKLSHLPPEEREKAIIGIKRTVQERFAVAVCAFGNADGGTVYLGVRDDGTITGLDEGMKVGGFSNYEDDFARNIETRLEDLIRDEVFVLLNIRIEFIAFGEKRVGRVQVAPSKKPLYLHSKNEQQFWVRGSAPRSKKLIGQAQARYIQEHFGGNMM